MGKICFLKPEIYLLNRIHSAYCIPIEIPFLLYTHTLGCFRTFDCIGSERSLLAYRLEMGVEALGLEKHGWVPKPEFFPKFHNKHISSSRLNLSKEDCLCLPRNFYFWFALISLGNWNSILAQVQPRQQAKAGIKFSVICLMSGFPIIGQK